MRLTLSLATLLFASTAFSGTTQVGPDEELGGYSYQVKGCDTIRNITGNIDGYEVSPEMSRDNSIVICEDDKYNGANMLEVFKQVAEKAAEKKCFQAEIDEANKKITITYLENNIVVTRTNTSLDTYSSEGYVTLERPRSSTRIRHLCVLNENGLEFPYDELLANPTM